MVVSSTRSPSITSVEPESVGGGVQVEAPASAEASSSHAAGPGVGGQPEERRRRCLAASTEAAELRWRPDRARARRGGSAAASRARQVRRQDLLDPDRVSERLAERAGARAPPSETASGRPFSAVGSEVGVERRQHRRPEALEAQAADPRRDVPLDVGAVAGGGAGLDTACVRRDPSARYSPTVSAERSTYSPRRAATRASSRAALAAASVAKPPTHFGRDRPVSGRAPG